MNPFEIEGQATMTRVNGGEDDVAGATDAALRDEYGQPYGSDDDDEEDEPLVNGSTSDSNGHYRDEVDENGTSQDSSVHRRSSRTSTAADSLKQSNASLCQKGSMLILLILAGGAAMRYFMPDSYGPSFDHSSDGPSNGTYGVILDPDRPVPTLDPKNFGSYRNVQLMRQKFRTARDELVNRLRREYGPDNFENIFAFDNITVGRLLLRSAGLEAAPTIAAPGEKPDDMGISWNRLRRKFLMKLLQVQILTKKKDGIARMPKFVWASGGHSAAAAHGDLYNESYSAVLERAVQPVFSELGVWFEGRNYAMGGTASAPEVALCSVPIFGNDMDALSWDFGMTDGNGVTSTEMYYRQASFSPSRPACMVLDGGIDRIKIMQHLEDSGVAAFYFPSDVNKKAFSGVPDSFGLSEAEIQAMPPFVKSFKCEGAIEKGEPGCDAAKWTYVGDVCKGAKYRTSWHPGWKWHALWGNMLSLAMIEVVDDALDELAKLDLKDPVARYRELKDEEDREYEAFSASEPIYVDERMIKPNRTDATKDFDLSLLFNRPAYCHTSRLPAETRYLGILTERPDRVGFFHYDVGMTHEQARDEANNSTRLRLGYDAGERQDCSLLLQMDYKDYFYIGETEGSKSLVLPNDMELLYYPMKEPLLGLVGFSMTTCDWGHCPKGNLLEANYTTGEWEMSVNGVPVTGFVDVHPNGQASFARHKDGWYFPPNADGRFEIQVRVNSVGNYVRFSSFIIL